MGSLKVDSNHPMSGYSEASDQKDENIFGIWI